MSSSRRQRKMKRKQARALLENPMGIFGPGRSLKDVFDNLSIRPKGRAMGGSMTTEQYMKRNDGGIASKTRMF
jgi:hypothetical protein